MSSVTPQSRQLRFSWRFYKLLKRRCIKWYKTGWCAHRYDRRFLHLGFSAAVTPWRVCLLLVARLHVIQIRTSEFTELALVRVTLVFPVSSIRLFRVKSFLVVSGSAPPPFSSAGLCSPNGTLRHYGNLFFFKKRKNSYIMYRTNPTDLSWLVLNGR